jgi:hypothetical protein
MTYQSIVTSVKSVSLDLLPSVKLIVVWCANPEVTEASGSISALDFSHPWIIHLVFTLSGLQSVLRTVCLLSLLLVTLVHL